MAKKLGQKQNRKLLHLADELLVAAQDVYDNDDVFTCDSTRQQAEERRDRDRALGEAIAAYVGKRDLGVDP